jgi:hypothetical protein
MFRSISICIPLMAMTLAGCAGMSEQECFVTDWRSVGFEDAVAGRTEAAIGNYREACARHGIAPDLTRYRQGHSDGVEVYCRPSRGFEAGRRGSRYQGICPAALESDFLNAYTEGRQLYELEAALRGIDNQIASRERRLDVLERDMAAASAAIIADGSSAEQRAQLLLDTAAMAREYGETEEELEALAIERVLRADDLAAYQQTLAFGF